MGKNRSKKRRAESEQRSPSSIAASLVGKRKLVELECGAIEPEDLEITIQTLNRVATQEGALLETLAAKRYKDLRRALHPFQEAWRERFDPIDYPARVTALLEQQQWTPVLFALEGCAYYFENKLKRGTIQRWVRFCDECKSPGLKLKLIAAILRCASPETPNEDGAMNRHDPRRVLLEQDLEGISRLRIE
ncbi:prolyl 4-hydroxylase alpha-subunit [Fragilaria crotonensis]|nr:prolyl 4-hydroxylase alpha-subunit [Fragilaria crotonensis]